MSTQYDRLVVERKLAVAKRKFSEAVAAASRGDTREAKAAKHAYREIEAAREELKRIAGQSLSDEWAEMKRLRDERG